MQGTETTPVCSESGRKYLRLQMTEQVGPIRVQALLKHFHSVDAILAASQAELQRVENIGPITAKAVFRSRNDFGPVDEEIQNAADYGVRIVCLEDAEYPAPLRHIPDPPVCLYVRGTLEPADAVSVGIVGTRRCSHYGREQAGRFAELLARAGFTVISGLARGVDGFAHRGALRGGGRTIAVLGNGLSTVYPPEHEELSDEIVARGALITELPIDAAPEAKNFPGRNRIIAGISLGTLVIEAGKRSGALITARLANEYNREAFALPGNVDRGDWTAGTNALIREGAAKLVTCLEDILDELGDVGRIMTPGGAVSDGSSGGYARSGIRGDGSGVRGDDGSGEGGRHAERSEASPARPGPEKPEILRCAQNDAKAAPKSSGPNLSAPKSSEPMSSASKPPMAVQHQGHSGAMSVIQQQVFEAIAAGAEHPDLVCESTGLNAGPVAAAITHLQLTGLLVSLPGNRLQLRTPIGTPAGR